jgi:DNA polymerase Ligase (LigD)
MSTAGLLSMPQFVLLYHECPRDYVRPSHWDLMLEAGGSLRTWALLELPRGWQAARSYTASSFAACADSSANNLVEAERLGDHRRDYLEYEGPLSGKRGQVTRIDAGSFETIEESGERWQVELFGERLLGQVILKVGEANANRWTLTLYGPD